MRLRKVFLTAGLSCLMTVGMTAPAQAYHTNFTAGCSDSAIARTHQKRSYAVSYALEGRYEGYQWGGGCWNDDNRDNSPNDPTNDTATKGEGGDCSGFTTKTWQIASSGSTAFTWRKKEMNYHGPYPSGSYMSATTAWRVISRSASSTNYMDAFASSYHIAMLYSTASNGADAYIEAKSEAAGTQLMTEVYRGNTKDFTAASRNGWENECYPQCVN